MVKDKELIVLTKDYRGYKAGTLGYFAGYTLDSGYNVAIVVVIDEHFHSYMSKHKEFSNFDEYISYQKRASHFGDQYWTQPFTVIKPYKDGIATQSEIQDNIDKLSEVISEAQNKAAGLIQLKKSFPVKAYSKYK